MECYANITTGTVSTTGTQVVLRTPKYRIIPEHNTCYVKFYLQVKRWWGWKTIEEANNRERLKQSLEHLRIPIVYYDAHGEKI